MQPSLECDVEAAMSQTATLILGYAGTGKSFVACASAEYCHQQDRKVAVFTWAKPIFQRYVPRAYKECGQSGRVS